MLQWMWRWERNEDRQSASDCSYRQSRSKAAQTTRWNSGPDRQVYQRNGLPSLACQLIWRLIAVSIVTEAWELCAAVSLDSIPGLSYGDGCFCSKYTLFALLLLLWHGDKNAAHNQNGWFGKGSFIFVTLFSTKFNSNCRTVKAHRAVMAAKRPGTIQGARSVSVLFVLTLICAFQVIVLHQPNSWVPPC